LQESVDSQSAFATLALRIRRHVLQMTHKARSSHLGGCFSVADLLAVLYGKTLHVKPNQPDWVDRDRVILSKGHGAAALYAALAESGFFPLAELDSFYQDGSALVGHVTHTSVPGIEVSTGSLGHGLPIGCGMALAAKRDAHESRIFVLFSDGECDEGSTWEAALFAPHHCLDNLVAIIDYNKIQSLGRVQDVLNLDPLAEKWRAFGWFVVEIDGHNFSEIESALSQIPVQPGRPTCVVAHTVKGKGVSFMEDKLLWHYRSPDTSELEAAIRELGGGE